MHNSEYALNLPIRSKIIPTKTIRFSASKSRQEKEKDTSSAMYDGKTLEKVQASSFVSLPSPFM
ncbi:MAG: hypothetical protein HRU34_09875 [Richelia sp.]|nr:hypothetical protein [Richelia sp.]